MKETKVRITAIEKNLGECRQGPETALYIGDELVMRGHAAEFDIIGLTICFVTEGGEQFSIDCEYNEDKHKALKKAAENREWLNMQYKTAND